MVELNRPKSSDFDTESVANHNCKDLKMSVLNHSSTNQQLGFRSFEAVVTRLQRRFASPVFEEFYKVVPVLMVSFVVMALVIALAVWIWVPLTHQ